MKEQDLSKKIGDRIKEMRKKQNLSQQDLSALVDMEISNISRIENGRTNVTVLTLYKFSKALNCKLKDLISVD